MDELNKSIDSLIEELFAEPVEKSLDLAKDSKTTADAALAAVPSMEDDAARGAGRPKQIADVPETDEDGKRAGQYDASISSVQAEEENEEAKKQARSVSQLSEAGRLSQAPSMKDPRLTKSVSEEEYAEFEAFKKAKAEKEEATKLEVLKKAEDLKKVETETLIKAAVESALGGLRKENEELKKSMNEQTALVKAMAAQPVRAKSVTGIEALEKSTEATKRESNEFSKSEKLDAAERLVMKKSLPMDAVIELENTGTVYNPQHRALIEAELQKDN